jgi:hypothetical protein
MFWETTVVWRVVLKSADWAMLRAVVSDIVVVLCRRYST